MIPLEWSLTLLEDSVSFSLCVIEESKSSCCMQIVIVKDDLNRYKKRMCVDYSATVNIDTQLDADPLPKLNQW